MRALATDGGACHEVWGITLDFRCIPEVTSVGSVGLGLFSFHTGRVRLDMVPCFPSLGIQWQHLVVEDWLGRPAFGEGSSNAYA